MNFLGKYLLSGRLQAVGVISLMTVLSLLLPPFSYIISGAPVSLLALRKGSVFSVQVLFGSLLVTSLFGHFTSAGTALGAAYAVGVWFPVWLVSIILRLTESQTMLLLGVAAIGVLMVIGSFVYNAELTLLWQTWRDQFLQQGFSESESVQIGQMFDTTLPLLNGIMAAGLVLSLACTVLLARWWQSRMFNPGGFRTEFQQLLLPRWLSLVSFGFLALSLVDTGDYQWQIRSLLIVLIVIQIIQGIASVHRIIERRGMSSNWLIAMYAFMLVLPQMALFLACIGMVDGWNRQRKSPPADQA
jgi:Predicted membrane protein (DUF2232)